MKKWVRTAAALAGLLALLILCQKSGEMLRNRLEEGKETSGSIKDAGPVVIIDAGHGGLDGGKTGENGAVEKDVNLSIAIKTKKFLENSGCHIIMTRTTDERLADTQAGDLKARVSLMNETEDAKLAVSIHQNSYHEESVRGAQTFYYTDSAEGKKAAEIIQEEMRKLDEENTKLSKANSTYYILKKTEIPVVIAECGFLSNYEEAELLVSEEYQETVAETIGTGVLRYLQLTE